MRPTFKPTRNSRILSLKCYDELIAHLRNGVAIAEIARWLQEERLEYTDVGRASLVTILTKYRKEQFPDPEPEDEDEEVTANERKKRAAQALRSVGFTVKAELEDLYRTQKERIKMGVANEQRFQFLNPKLYVEISTAGALLRQIDEVSSREKEQPLEQSLRPTAMSQVGQVYDDKVKGVMANPASRLKLLNALAAAKKAAEVKEDEESKDGQQTA